MKPLRILAAIAAAGALAACSDRAPEGQTAGTYTLRYASNYSPGHPFSKADIAWMKHVEAASGGRLKIEPQWSGALLSAEQSMLELRHGVADIGLITPIYARGGVHAVRAQSGFYGGVKTIPDQVAVYKCLAREFPVLDRELEGLRVLAIQGGNLPAIVTRDKPVRTLADLEGLRLRAPVELIPILRRLGADPVNMPMGEVYSAMAKGIVDGVVAPGDTLRSLHFAEVAEYYSQLSVSRGGYPARAISEIAWRRLPPDLQRVLAESQPVWEAAMSREIGGSLAVGEKFGREHGVAFVAFDPAEQRRFDAMYNEEAAASAEHLRGYGVDGPAIFRRAQALVAQANRGEPLPCAAPAEGGVDAQAS